MMYVFCSSLECRTAMHIMARDMLQMEMLVGPGSTYWPDKYTCPRCNGPAVGAMEKDINPRTLPGFTIIELEAEELFRALNGMGLPDEQLCQMDVLTKLFSEKRVSKLVGFSIPGTERCCLEWMEMEDGTRVFFGSSSYGATIYRITNKTSAVENELRRK